MLAMRHSSAQIANNGLKEEPPLEQETNVAWLQRVRAKYGVVMFGGTSLADFRIRVAQSHLRDDMLPSLWSHCGILLGDGRFASVPLDLNGDISSIPVTNGVRISQLADYHDPKLYPNVAVIEFTSKPAALRDGIKRTSRQRNVVDFSSLILPWLGFIWGASGCTNPLLSGHGLPSGVFVETVFAMAGLELTPGLTSASSCPEAIWLSAKWWEPFFRSVSDAGNSSPANAIVPKGWFAIRQMSAAVHVEPDPLKGI